MLVVIIIPTSAFNSISPIEMAADVQSLDVLHTLAVCRSPVQW